MYAGCQHATVIAFSPTFASQRQEAGKHFMVAYMRGLRDFIDAFDKGVNRDRVISILTNTTTLKDPALWKNVPQ